MRVIENLQNTDEVVVGENILRNLKKQLVFLSDLVPMENVCLNFK